jgi:hypothetical protein
VTLIRANSVVVDDDDPNVILVGFEQVTVDSRQYLMLQRSYEFDERDIELGTNEVYLERDDQFWSAYGGILYFALERNRALIKLGGETAAKLGGESDYEISFDVGDYQFAVLRNGLTKVFKDFGCYVDKA